jgi:hypothetical protein
MPPLRETEQTLSVTELLRRGIITDYDNIDSLMPSVDSRATEVSAPLFGGIQIDISGAAQSYRVRKEKRMEEIREITAKLAKNAPEYPDRQR